MTDLSCDETNSCLQELWSIESGVEETSKTRNGLPVEVSQELDRRVRQVGEEFSVLAQMVNKCEFRCYIRHFVMCFEPRCIHLKDTNITCCSRRQREPQRWFRHEVSDDVCRY